MTKHYKYVTQLQLITNRCVFDHEQFIADPQPAVAVRGAARHYLGDVDTIVARYVLVAHTARYTEPQT